MENKRCDICQLYREEIPIDPRRYICLDCDLRYLYGIADKARAIYEARELVRIQKLGLRQALKIVAGRLSLGCVVI